MNLNTTNYIGPQDAPPSSFYGAGEEREKIRTYLQAIALNPHDASAYRQLGEIIGAGQSITLHNGERMTQFQLYLTTIDLDPADVTTYHVLGTALPDGGCIQLLNRTMMSKQELLNKT